MQTNKQSRHCILVKALALNFHGVSKRCIMELSICHSTWCAHKHMVGHWINHLSEAL